jgi:hypothetical protein
MWQVWVRDVHEAVELLDEQTGQRTPKDQVCLSEHPLIPLRQMLHKMLWGQSSSRRMSAMETAGKALPNLAGR